jgi:hypothetical protein
MDRAGVQADVSGDRAQGAEELDDEDTDGEAVLYERGAGCGSAERGVVATDVNGARGVVSRDAIDAILFRTVA